MSHKHDGFHDCFGTPPLYWWKRLWRKLFPIRVPEFTKFTMPRIQQPWPALHAKDLVGEEKP